MATSVKPRAVTNMKNTETFLASKKNAILLTAFGAVCTILVSLTYVLTNPVIQEQERLQTYNKVTQVLDNNRFDNNPLLDCIMLEDDSITGVNKATPVYRARLNNEPYALVYQTQTKQGYNGLIKILVALDKTGEVQGVRTLTHTETPGLGDKIELSKSDWVLSFNEKSVNSEDDQHWFVKKDGGDFDQFTGATITPRAIVNQLRTSIYRITGQFDQLFSQPNACQSPQTTTEPNNDN